MTHIEQTIYGTVTKKDLLWKANMVKERFNNANFKSKRSGGKQIINRVEVVEHGTTVYFWCGRMNNFAVYGGSKKVHIINYAICYCIFVLMRIKTILVFQILL